MAEWPNQMAANEYLWPRWLAVVAAGRARQQVVDVQARVTVQRQMGADVDALSITSSLLSEKEVPKIPSTEADCDVRVSFITRVWSLSPPVHPPP